VVIFDCNGVLVDSEPLATAVVSQEFMHAGFPLTPDMVARYFTGRRPTDMFAEVEFATGRKLPVGFAAGVADPDPFSQRTAPNISCRLCVVVAARAEMPRIVIVD